MPGVNFYHYDSCQCITAESCFGIVELADNTPVSMITDRSAKWGATVNNPAAKKLLVLPIDKNVPIRKIDNPHDEERLCDLLIRSYMLDEFLIFIELKDWRKSPLNDAAKQIGITIEHYQLHHQVDSFKFKKAFVTNGGNSGIQASQKDLMRAFKNKYGFVLRMSGTIDIPN